MNRGAVRAMAGRLLAQARALRAAFPDPAALRAVEVGDVLMVGPEPALAAALGYLRDEMLVVRAGRAEGSWVLDDEVANVERLLTGR